jgi:hypothetical protein
MSVRLFKLFAILLCCCSGASALSGPSTREQKLFDLVNKERERAGLQKLAWDARLAEAARAHSELMARNDELSHQFSKEPSVLRRAGASGARFDSVAENVAEAGSVSEAHQALMQSERHRENILEPDYNAVGIAIVEEGKQLWITQDFARIISVRTPAQVSDDVVAAVHRLRQAHGLRKIDVRSDARMKRQACAQDSDAGKIKESYPSAAELVVFTTTDPRKLPDTMRNAALNRRVVRVDLGVCFEPGDSAGFSRYWVVAAFY